MRRSRFKLVFLGLMCLGLVATSSAASVLVEGLEDEDLNVTYQNSSINFEGSYVNKNVSYQDALIPKNLQDDLKKWQVKSKSKSGDLTELQVQYEFDKSTGYSSLNGYKFDSKITFNESGISEYKVKGGALNVTAKSHYEHLVLNYEWYGGSAENVYSGSETTRIPVSGEITQYSAGKVGQTATVDNLYEEKEYKQLVFAHDPDTNISGKSFDAPRCSSFSYSNDVEPELDAANITGFSINPDNYELECFNVSVPADTKKSFEVNYSQPVYNPLTDNPENYNFQYYSYVIGSVATFKTNSSSEWQNGTFNYTEESSGKLKLSGKDLDIAYGKKDSSEVQYVDISGNVVDTGVYAPDGIGAIGNFDSDSDKDILYANSTLRAIDKNSNTYDFGLSSGGVGDEIGDLDGDGDLDIPFRDSNKNLKYVDSSGNVVDTGVQATIVGGVGDIDGDGDLDIPFRDPQEDLRYVDGSGNSKSLGATAYMVGGVADIDGDGDQDAVYRDGNFKLRSVDNSGNKKYYDTLDIYSIGDVADLDGDGDQDIVYENENSELGMVDNSNNTEIITTGILKVGGIGDFDGDGDSKDTGTYKSKVYTASEKKVWDNITVGNYAKNGGTIDIWVMTSNDGSPSTSPLETEKISSSELSSSGTTIIDLGFTEGATDVKYNISMSKGSSSPSIDSIEIDGKTANKAPQIKGQEVEWTSIGGTASKLVNLSLNDPDGQEISSYNSLNGLSEQKFNNNTLKASGWSSPVDTVWNVDDFKGALSSNAEVNFTVQTDTGVREDDYSHSLDKQQVNYTVEIKNRGDKTNYTISFSDQGTVQVDGSLLEKTVASGSSFKTTEVWSNDFITGETESSYQLGQKTSKNSDLSKQYFYNQTKLEADNSKSFKFASVNLSSTCGFTTSADVPSGNGKTVTNSCNNNTFSADNLKEQNFGFKIPDSSVTLGVNYTGKRNLEVDEQKGVNWDSISTEGQVTEPKACSQSNSSSISVSSNAVKNFTVGFDCNPGNNGNPEQTIKEITSLTERVWYNSTDMVIETNNTENKTIAIRADKDNLKSPNDRDGGSLNAFVEGVNAENNDYLTVSDTGSYFRIEVKDGFQNSSLHTDDSDWSVTYVLNEEGSGGGGGGGGGTGPSTDDLAVYFGNSQTENGVEEFSVPFGETVVRDLRITNRKQEDLNVEISAESTGICRYVSVRPSLSSTSSWSSSGTYSLEGAEINNLGTVQENTVTTQIRFRLPNRTVLENEGLLDGDLSCGFETASSFGKAENLKVSISQEFSLMRYLEGLNVVDNTCFTTGKISNNLSSGNVEKGDEICLPVPTPLSGSILGVVGLFGFVALRRNWI